MATDDEKMPDAVLVVHGTFAHRPTDTAQEVAEQPSFWQLDGEFVASVNEMLGDVAQCWPTDLRDVFPWRTHNRWAESSSADQRLTGRQLFAWSGRNSDNDRRAAGKRLYFGLLALEERGRDYHLIGHSHGGTVIWHALQEAALRAKSPDGNLPHLKSWSTLGTPFPAIQTTPWQWGQWSFGLPAIVGLLYVLGLTKLFSLTFGEAIDVLWWGHGLSIVSMVVLIGLILFATYVVLNLLYGIRRRIDQRWERAAMRAAWKCHGQKWLGQYSLQDETMAATYISVDLHARGLLKINWPGRPPFHLLRNIPLWWARLLGQSFGTVVGVILAVLAFTYSLALWLLSWPFSAIAKYVVSPLADFVVNAILGPQWRSDDRFGTRAVYFSPEPVLHSPRRGPLPKALNDALLNITKTHIASSANNTFEALGQQARKAANTSDERDPFSDLLAQVDFVHVTPHTSYYATREIQQATAFHVLQHSRRAKVRHADHIARLFDEETKDWLARYQEVEEFSLLPPTLNDTSYRAPNTKHLPQRRGAAQIGLWPQCLVASFLLAALFAGAWNVRRDISADYPEMALTRIANDAKKNVAFLDFSSERDTVGAIVKLQPLVQGQLFAQLGSGVDEQRQVAAELVGLLDPEQLGEESLNTLVAIAFDPNEEIRGRYAAKRSLLLFSSDKIPSRLIAAFKAEQDPGIRKSILFSLWWLAIREKESGIDKSESRWWVEFCIHVARDRGYTDGTRDIVASILREFRLNDPPPTVVKLLTDVLTHAEHDASRIAAANVLCRIKNPSEATVTALISAVEKRQSFSTEVIEAMSQLDDPPVSLVNALIRLLKTKDAENAFTEDAFTVIAKQYAVTSLGKLATADAVLALLNTANDPTASRARSLLRDLDNPTPAVLQMLRKVFSDSNRDPKIRVWAAEALRNARTPTNDAIAMLRSALNQDQETDLRVRVAAAGALGLLDEPTPEVMTILIDALSDNNEVVRQDAAWALVEFDELSRSAVIALLKLGASQTGEDGFQSVLHGLHAPSIEAVNALLNDKSLVATIALKTLEPTPEIVERLVEVMNNPVADVEQRIVAAEALGELRQRQHPLDPAIELGFRHALNSDVIEIRTVADIAIGQVKKPTPADVSAALGALEGESFSELHGACVALVVWEMHQDRVAQALSEYILDDMHSLPIPLEGMSPDMLRQLASIKPLRRLLQNTMLTRASKETQDDARALVLGMLIVIVWQEWRNEPDVVIGLVDAAMDNSRFIQNGAQFALQQMFSGEDYPIQFVLLHDSLQ